jgi:hypothetical protein
VRRPPDPQGTSAAVAELLLCLLLGRPLDPPSVPRDFWARVPQVGRDSAVLLRVAAALERVGIDGPTEFLMNVATERRRAEALFAAVQAVSRVCAEHGVAHCFPKAFQHYPDMGRDADLLVLARPAALAPILGALGTTPRARTLSTWLAATVQYQLPGSPGPLDIQYGTLGLVGEHRGYAAQLVANCTRAVLDGATVIVPTAEDQLILQGIQRVFGRLSLRLADLVWTIDALRRLRLDWDYVVHTARRIDATHGLGCFLTYVEQIHGRIFGSPLLPAAVHRHLPLRGWGAIEFRHGRYRFPALRVNARLSAAAFEAKLVRRDWAGVARLSLVPLLGAAATLGRRPLEGAR